MVTENTEGLSSIEKKASLDLIKRITRLVIDMSKDYAGIVDKKTLNECISIGLAESAKRDIDGFTEKHIAFLEDVMSRGDY